MGFSVYDDTHSCRCPFLWVIRPWTTTSDRRKGNVITHSSSVCIVSIEAWGRKRKFCLAHSLNGHYEGSLNINGRPFLSNFQLWSWHSALERRKRNHCTTRMLSHDTRQSGRKGAKKHLNNDVIVVHSCDLFWQMLSPIPFCAVTRRESFAQFLPFFFPLRTSFAKGFCVSFLHSSI